MASRKRRQPDTQSSVHADRSAPLWALAWTPAGGLEEIATVNELKEAYAQPDSRIWVDTEDADRDVLLAIAGCFQLHPLITDDILERNQRAKVEEIDNNIHVVMFALHDEGDRIAHHEIDIVLGERFLFTAHDPAVKPREAPFMRRTQGVHLEKGVDYLLWAICDWLVDDYFPVFDFIGEQIDEMEDEVTGSAPVPVAERLFSLRKDLLTIRRAVNPVREVFNQLTNRDLPYIPAERVLYFRDIYDHLIRLTDELDSYRDLVSSTHDIYLSQVNNNLSEVMKRLTAVTAVLATIGAVGGIFGMSEAGPALDFQENLGFWAVTAAALILAGLVFYLFRKRGWV